MPNRLKVFVVAGEPSGDRLGASLIKGLKTNQDIDLRGVGGPLMEHAGLTSLFPMDQLAIMGLMEILPKIPMLLRRIRQTAEAALNFRPDVLVTIDSPDFCMRVAKRVRKVWPDVKVVHYVAPSVWAWRPERAAKMAQHVDHVLALLPFEPPYMIDAGMSCDFVGHPITEQTQPSQSQIEIFKSNFPTKKLIAILPGSRRGEVKRMLPIYREALVILKEMDANLHAIIPTVRGSQKDVKLLTQNWPIPITYIEQSTSGDWDHKKQTAIAAAQGALVTSGTVSLEVAAANCPQIVAYQANSATTKMIKQMAQIDTASLINILTQSGAVPEYLFEDATPENIAGGLAALLGPTSKAADQKILSAQAMALLRPPEPNAPARAILRFLEEKMPDAPMSRL
ncbi:MAG: lipid-A-disaccharide synthase [Pseudomonadota bacterium]